MVRLDARAMQYLLNHLTHLKIQVLERKSSSEFRVVNVSMKNSLLLPEHTLQLSVHTCYATLLGIFKAYEYIHS